MDRLEENRRYYEHCIPILKQLYEAKLYEDCLQYARKLGTHCWFNFSGLYNSHEIERVLNKIGTKILPTEINKDLILETNSAHILHICSDLYETGGHTKLLYRWIANDTFYQHSILSTRMKQHELERITVLYRNTKIHSIDTLNSTSLVDQASELFEKISAGYKFIILHTHPDEVLTTVVLSHPQLRIPVFFVNHADHTFWLGASISDKTIQIREPNINLDKIRRQIYNSYYLPIPIEFPQEIHTSPAQSTGIIKLLTIGLEAKYKPDKEYNFYAEMLSIVNRHPNVEVDFIGIYSDSYEAKQYQHPRLNYLGSLPHQELKKYREECDLYIEGFPMPSFTALLETVLFKKPFILHYNPKPIFSLFEPHNAIIYPKDKEEWRESLDRLIIDKSHREIVSNQQYNFIYNEYSPNSWLARLKKLYLIGDYKAVKKEKTLDEVFLNSYNEQIVVNILETRINHLSFLENLNFYTKIKIFLLRPKSYSMLNKIRQRELFKFFFPKLFYYIKRKAPHSS